jgi:EAL domain-containing protein (putative c-di-GMP-specific phosphodiesterase class I)
MPDMDGLNLLRAVRERDLDIPVLLMTGGPSIETAIDAVEHGALQYLIKPVPMDTLVESSRRAVTLGALARLKREALRTTGFGHLSGDRAGLEAHFVRALPQIWMACQPIVRACDGCVVAHEALLRSSDSRYPLPGALLSSAERLGCLPILGAAVRAASAELIGSGAVEGLLFVNVHPIELADDAILDPDAPLSLHADRVVLEVTERASLDRLKDVTERVRGLRALGYRVAIDDLGAGYSGLTSFAALSPEYVKLDRALVRNLDHRPIQQKLVGSIVALCRELEITVIAEGVETPGECEQVTRLGCDLMQGHLVGAPARLAAA